MHLTGEISTRDRTALFKGTMFAAFPGDIVFSKIDARSGAIGMLPPEIGQAVVTPEFPVFTADPARLHSAFVKLVLRTGGFIVVSRRKASGTSGRKRITPEAFQDLRIPLTSSMTTGMRPLTNSDRPAITFSRSVCEPQVKSRPRRLRGGLRPSGGPVRPWPGYLRPLRGFLRPFP